MLKKKLQVMIDEKTADIIKTLPRSVNLSEFIRGVLGEVLKRIEENPDIRPEQLRLYIPEQKKLFKGVK